MVTLSDGGIKAVAGSNVTARGGSEAAARRLW
jgi:hypothetical protein